MRSEIVKRPCFAGLLTIWIFLGPGICRRGRKKSKYSWKEEELLPSRQMGERNPELKGRKKRKYETHLFSLPVQIS